MNRGVWKECRDVNACSNTPRVHSEVNKKNVQVVKNTVVEEKGDLIAVPESSSD